jgi:hypothetical protein
MKGSWEREQKEGGRLSDGGRWERGQPNEKIDDKYDRGRQPVHSG